MEQFLGLPPVASAHGAELDHSIIVIHYLMFALFLGWGVFFISLLVRFRKSKNPKASYTGNKSKFALYLAGLIAVFELGMLFAVDAPLWARRVSNLPDPKDAVVVRVVAEQFAWNVHYPGKDGKFGKRSISLVDGENPLGLDRTDPDAKDDITTINQLYLPVGKPVIIYLSSKDVIHSFNLPLFRVKQDVIPGITVPVWFEPVKTTAQIREEEAHLFSVAELMKKTHMMTIPAAGTMNLGKGMSMDNMMAMQDYADAQGNALAAKGDKLNSETVERLVAGGVTQVKARDAVTMDKFIANEDVKDASGNVVLPRNEILTDDAVTKLAEAGVRQVNARPLANMDTFVFMEAYNDKSGSPIVNKGDGVSDDLLSKLADNGIDNALISAATPTEIACAQLCGLGHYRMRGYVNIVTPEEYQQWLDQQEAALAPPAEPAADTTHTAAADSSAAVASQYGSAH